MNSGIVAEALAACDFRDTLVKIYISSILQSLLSNNYTIKYTGQPITKDQLISVANYSRTIGGYAVLKNEGRHIS